MTANPNEPATDAVNRTAQEVLAALQAKDSAKVNSYYAPDAVIATAGRPAAKDGRAVSKAIRDDIADPNFKMSLSNEKTEVAGSGDLAYRRGTFKITYTNPQTKQAENAGHLLDRLQEAGGRKLEGGGRFRSLARLVCACGLQRGYGVRASGPDGLGTGAQGRGARAPRAVDGGVMLPVKPNRGAKAATPADLRRASSEERGAVAARGLVRLGRAHTLANSRPEY